MSKAEEILEALAGAESHPAEMLREATKRKKELVPVFLAEIERWLDGNDEASRPAPLFYIFHLLGSWRATEAYEPLCRVLRADPERLAADLSDALVETAPRVMANLFEGDYVPLAAVVEDPQADEYARGAALDTLGALLHQGRVAREDVVEYLRGLAARLEPGAGGFLWGAWADLVADFRLTELREEAERVFAQRLVPSELMRATDLRLALAGKREPPDPMQWEPFGDAAEELADWEVFTAPEDEEDSGGDDEETYAPGEPAHNPYRDIGRNDPCPCGSGKKFKKCCGR